MEKTMNLSKEDKIRKRIDVEKWELKVRELEQDNEMRERDLKDDMPNKMNRLRIRENNVHIEKFKWDIKLTQKMLREGKETVEEVTQEDIEKFNIEKDKEDKNGK